MSTPEELSALFDDPAKALAILNKHLASNRLAHLTTTADKILDRLERILRDASRKRGKLKCALLENELAALTELTSHGHGGWQHGKSFSAIEDWSETFDDRDADDWESHYDPGVEYTDP